MPLTERDPPPVTVKAPNDPALPTVKLPLSVRATPVGMLRMLGAGAAVMLLLVLEMLATEGVGTALLRRMVPGVVVLAALPGVPRARTSLAPRAVGEPWMMVPL